MDEKIRALKTSDPGSVLCRLMEDKPGGEARHLLSALERKDPGALRILRETTEDLAFGLSHVTHLFHPQIIIVGGGLSGVGEPLRAAVEDALRGFLMDAFAPGPKVALAVLREDAVPTGALDLARTRLGAGGTTGLPN